MIRRNSKAIGGGLGAAVAIVLIWGADQLGITVSEEVAGAIVVVGSAAIAWIAPANRPLAKD